MSSLEAPELLIPELVAEPREFSRDDLRTARLLHVSLGLASVAILLAALLLQVHGETVVVPGLDLTLPQLCYWRTMFGMDCPGCGLTRCFISAAHGDLAAAWRFNPMGVLLFALVAVQVPYRPWQLWRLSTGRGEYQTLGLPYALLAVSVLLILQWFWRVML